MDVGVRGPLVKVLPLGLHGLKELERVKGVWLLIGEKGSCPERVGNKRRAVSWRQKKARGGSSIELAVPVLHMEIYQGGKRGKARLIG